MPGLAQPKLTAKKLRDFSEAEREMTGWADKGKWWLEDNPGHIGRRIWLDQNRITAAFGKLAFGYVRQRRSKSSFKIDVT